VGSLTPKLPLFSVPLMHSMEPSGMLTPPLHSLALVPFRWEEEPGKPRPCTALATVTNVFTTKCLELPPRLLSNTSLHPPRSWRVLMWASLKEKSHELRQEQEHFKLKFYIFFRNWGGPWPLPAPPFLRHCLVILNYLCFCGVKP